jgi:hypothetical protein
MKKADLQFCLAALFVCAITVLQIWAPQGSGVKKELVAPPSELQHFTFGFRMPVSDLFWVRVLQDIDYCDTQDAANPRNCKGQDWLYKTLDFITDLDPKFRMAFSAGTIALSIIVSDIPGASLLFDKAVENFPTDWSILYRASYHAVFEESDYEKGARLVEQAARHGAPDWTFGLAARLYGKAGRREMIEGMIQSLEAEGADPKVLDLVRKRARDFDTSSL